MDWSTMVSYQLGRACINPDMVFTSIEHLINKELRKAVTYGRATGNQYI